MNRLFPPSIEFSSVSTVLLAGFVLSVVGAPRSPAEDLYRLPPGVQTRWASPENPSGARGAAAQTNQGRKGQPSFALPAGGTRG